MTVYRFQEICATARHRVTCPVCDKKRYVTRTFTKTVNPFNTNDDGTIKTPAEVSKAVHAKADAWIPSSRESMHQACYEAERGRCGGTS